jgi:DNA-binding transcriptional ArsR family regulator
VAAGDKIVYRKHEAQAAAHLHHGRERAEVETVCATTSRGQDCSVDSLQVFETCNPMTETTKDELISCAMALSVLGHPARLMLFGFLCQRREMPKKELRAMMRMTAPGLSQHLHQLERARLIERPRDRPVVIAQPDVLGRCANVLLVAYKNLTKRNKGGDT